MKTYKYIGSTSTTIQDGENEVLLYNGVEVQISDAKADDLKGRGLIEEVVKQKETKKD